MMIRTCEIPRTEEKETQLQNNILTDWQTNPSPVNRKLKTTDVDNGAAMRTPHELSLRTQAAAGGQTLCV